MREKVPEVFIFISAPVVVLVFLVILGYIFANGARVISLEFLLSTPRMAGMEGGIFPMIVGSVYVVAVCMVFAVPLGIGAAIYLAEYAPENAITDTIRFFVDCLAGIPSIVIGLFGLTFLVHFLNLGYSILAAGIALAFMILPWTVRVSEEAIKAVPRSYREASLALGATKWTTIHKVVLKSAMPGIITGVLLGLGRAIGETAVLLLTLGSAASAFIPTSPFDSAGTLPVFLYVLATQGNTANAYARACGTALVLLAIFLVVNILAIYVRNKHMKYEGW
ncbi:phosphate ABC transporter permease PstA [Candidatus Alkanophaga liquidiphilum]